MTSLEKTVPMTRLEVRPLAWSLVAMLYLSAFLPSIALALLLLGFVSFQALKEFFTIMPLRRSERRLVLLGYLSIPIQLSLIGTQYYALALALIPFVIFALAAWLVTHYETTAQAFNSILKLGWGLFTLVLGFSHLGLLLVRNGELEGVLREGNLLFYLLLLVNAQTIMQATLLRWRVNDWSRPLFNISLTGLAGILSVLAVGILAWGLGPWLLALTPVNAMVSGLLVGGGAYLGSTTLRAIQHALEINEADRHLPGLGGILFYIYPFAYAAPLFFYYVTLFA
jgi:phosphatidate cytidylyltransferase